jgi:hypothetical protein
VTYKQWSLDSKVYALEVLDRFNGSWSMAASLLQDMQPVAYRHIQHTHLQYWSKQWLEGTMGGGRKKGGEKKSLVSCHCLGKMVEAVRTAIASGAAVAAAGSRLFAKCFSWCWNDVERWARLVVPAA